MCLNRTMKVNFAVLTNTGIFWPHLCLRFTFQCDRAHIITLIHNNKHNNTLQALWFNFESAADLSDAIYFLLGPYITLPWDLAFSLLLCWTSLKDIFPLLFLFVTDIGRERLWIIEWRFKNVDYNYNCKLSGALWLSGKFGVFRPGSRRSVAILDC